MTAALTRSLQPPQRRNWILVIFLGAIVMGIMTLMGDLAGTWRLWRQTLSVTVGKDQPAVGEANQTAILLPTNNQNQSTINMTVENLLHYQKVMAQRDAIRSRVRPFINATILDQRLPRRPTTPGKDYGNILVVYSGPTHLMNPDFPLDKYQKGHKKIELYRLNFEYFLKWGIQCRTQDTILVVTDVVADKYRMQVQQMHNDCHQRYNHSVILAVRNNTCLDLESVRVALYGRYVNVSNYDHFVYLNCGVTGPAKEWADIPWTSVFLERLNNKVKMSGLSLNCANQIMIKHLQSMMYAMDRVALRTVMEGGAIFNCRERVQNYDYLPKPQRHSVIVNDYEKKLSQLVLAAGYGIASLVRPTTLFTHNASKCTEEDLWITWRMEDYFGKVPSLNETIFFKTSRILDPTTAAEINFTLPVNWNW